jgi:hypothetical protein
MRARCTNDARCVSGVENEAVLDRMVERQKKSPEILEGRREVVQHPFGSSSSGRLPDARPLANARADFSLTALT